MGLKIPNLDKKDFDTRLKEAMAKLPSYTDNWTEYNTSDPGITLIELLAWIADINSYKLNKIRAEHHEALLKLLSKENEIDIDSFSKLQADFYSMEKLVTLADFEVFLLEDKRISKVKISADKTNNIIKIIIVPKSKDKMPIPKKPLLDSSKAILEEKVLLTTKIELINPTYLEVNVNIKIKTKLSNPVDLRTEINLQLEEFLHPVHGANDKEGWEFGEDIHISDIYLLLNKIEGIDIIDSILFNNDKTSVKLDNSSLPVSGKHNIEVLSIPSQRSCS